jgi:hypothetical protein
VRRQLFKLIRNIALLLVIIFLVDRGLGSILQYFLFKEKQGDSFVTRRAVTEASEDILIIGSSRAQHHYIPELITRKTGLSCFNFGRDGMKLRYYETIFDAILSYHKPKIIVMDLTFNDFEDDPEELQLVTSAIIPFMNENHALEDQIYNLSRSEYYKAKMSMLYRFNSLPISVIQHNIGIGNVAVSGYKPLQGSEVTMSKVSIQDNRGYKESKGRLQIFENIVKIAKARNIKLFVVLSPALQMPLRTPFISANKILMRYGSTANDYSKLFGITERMYFRDPGHLNDEGCRNFYK